MIDHTKLTEAQRVQLANVGLLAPYKRKNKYRAEPTVYGGVRYDSRAEAEYAKILDALHLADRVVWWLRQVWIPLGPDFGTRVDFLVGKTCSAASATEKIVRVHAVEVKGVETPQFKKIRKLWIKYGPFPMHIVKRGEIEIIEPNGA